MSGILLNHSDRSFSNSFEFIRDEHVHATMTSETYRIVPERGVGRFSREELGHIAISIIVLSVAFTILYRNSGWILNYFKYLTGTETMAYVLLFLMCAVLVVISFLFHELGHKFMAQRLGLWSEYRM